MLQSKSENSSKISWHPQWSGCTVRPLVIYIFAFILSIYQCVCVCVCVCLCVHWVRKPPNKVRAEKTEGMWGAILCLSGQIPDRTMMIYCRGNGSPGRHVNVMKLRGALLSLLLLPPPPFRAHRTHASKIPGGPFLLTSGLFSRWAWTTDKPELQSWQR